jgi:hypothetical protein
MRRTIDGIVIACMFVIIYINWTDFPNQSHVVSGPLIKIKAKE